MKAIINGIIVVGQELILGQALVFDEFIRELLPKTELNRSQMEIIDAGGRYVVPGFINVHIHGCGGADAMDGTAEALATMSRLLPSKGVTAYLPTTMTATQENITQALETVRQARAGVAGAQVLGCHLEGPFISPLYKGAQKEEYICLPQLAWLEPYSDVIKLITCAPELLQGEEFTAWCQAQGIVLSVGHSGADYATAQQAFATRGFSHVTHLYNAMTGLHHRQPGIVVAALADADVMCELICDNVHVHPVVQRLTYQLKGSEHIELITDSIRACLLGDGASELGGQQVTVHGMTATLADGTIAGSVLTMDRALANLQANTGASLVEVVGMVTSNPARELQLQDRGSLTVGKRADIVLCDENFHIAATYVGGEQVYQSKGE